MSKFFVNFRNHENKSIHLHTYSHKHNTINGMTDSFIVMQVQTHIVQAQSIRIHWLNIYALILWSFGGGGPFLTFFY